MQYVYVVGSNGKPLMPCKPAKARKLLKERKADVLHRTPFTIQLVSHAGGYVQDITLGVDAGSRHVGLSACTKDREVFQGELIPRNDIVKLLSDRRELRRGRRYRKTRYREPRFLNRVRSKKKGWLAPSVEVKIQEHITIIKRICSILPVRNVIIETAEFDLQRLKAMEEGTPLPVGTDYQKGKMYDFYNVRQYVLYRDGYRCQYCGETKGKLHVHHKESRKTGGNAPDNLITLCERCHKKLHIGLIILKEKGRRSRPTKDGAFMGIMRKTLLKRLRQEFKISVKETYGYITKYVREKHQIEKSHSNDARCICGFPKVKTCNQTFLIKAVRHHNRKLHKTKILKQGRRKKNQAAYHVFGFRLWDKVSYLEEEYFISGRRSSGYFALKRLDGKAIRSVHYKKLRFLEPCNNYLIERM